MAPVTTRAGPFHSAGAGARVRPVDHGFWSPAGAALESAPGRAGSCPRSAWRFRPRNGTGITSLPVAPTGVGESPMSPTHMISRPPRYRLGRGGFPRLEATATPSARLGRVTGAALELTRLHGYTPTRLPVRSAGASTPWSTRP